MKATESDLKNQLSDLREHHPALKPDELFLAWFLHSSITGSEEDAVQALSGGKGDKGIDALVVDHSQRCVTIVQSKFRKGIGKHVENRGDVMALANLPAILAEDERFAEFMERLNAGVAEKLRDLRRKLLRDGYRLNLYFVTTGRVTKSLRHEAAHASKGSEIAADLQIIDGKSILLILTDYLDGVAPPVSSIELPVESGNGVQVRGILYRHDATHNIESYILPVSARSMADVYAKAGIRLFARNVRGFLGGSTEVNRNMKETLANEPAFFWYYNNGITIICDEVESVMTKGRQILRITRPQVINGQQTTRTIHDATRGGTRASVVVRIIRVNRDEESGPSQFENLVSRIVAATNWQNAIKASDLMANDRRQIELERNLRQIGYRYVRKRMSKGEAKAMLGIGRGPMIRRDELAQAVAACDLDPSIIREGKERLFEESLYPQIFPNSDPLHYLPRYWLVPHVTCRASGKPERGYAKWLVTHFLWKHISRAIQGKASNRAFCENCRTADGFIGLGDAAESVFKAARIFFYRKRGKGEEAEDVSNFFKIRGRHREFESFWKSAHNTQRSRFRRAWKRFLSELREETNR